MLALAVRYLTGKAVATAVGNRSEAEWPPHPSRIYMALVAALYEGCASPDPAERRALDWLETQGPPQLRVPLAFRREAVTVFVPVNDSSSPLSSDGKKTAQPIAAHLPIGRVRQARQFPSVALDEEVVRLIWPQAELPAELREPLALVCARVTYVGHSSSLVHVAIDPSPPAPNLMPGVRGTTHRLRVAGPGTLADLDAVFLAGRRPAPGLFAAYGPPEEATRSVRGTFFSPEVVVLRKTGGDGLALQTTLRAAGAIRAALMCWSPQPPPELISGHNPSGGRSETPHLAILPLADVGHAHADGHLLGFGLALPRGCDDQARAALDEALGRWFADGGELVSPPLRWRFAPEEREVPPIALRPGTWTRPARRFATVTPMVLDRYPKRGGDAERSVAVSCERAGLPPPREIVIATTTLHEGVPGSRGFPAFRTRADRPARPHRHVVLTFDESVEGPLLLGAGRYLGLGMFRALDAPDDGGAR